MKLKNQIPKDFYRLFGSKYLDYYMAFLAAIYEESSRSCSVLGLTEQECRSIMNERMAALQINWEEERYDEDGALLSQSNMASVCLNYLKAWGWLRADFDEVLNCNVVSFPEYSQLYVELFQKLLCEEGGKERESLLAVYSYLFTYSTDQERNPEFLTSALSTSRGLVQLLTNMQEGMRAYFDELSRQRELRGIQEVLVREIRNSDSKRYAILTTTDSFYRYKEAVKELMEQCTGENEERRQELLDRLAGAGEGGAEQARIRRAVESCDRALDTICLIGREFDAIERKYNNLIRQKTVFASRAAARIRYILQEGANREDGVVVLINLLTRSEKREEILEELGKSLRLSAPHRVMGEGSLFSRRQREVLPFQPGALGQAREEKEQPLESFVPKPLYTKQELLEFRRQHTKDGRFCVEEGSIGSVEELEKLLFVWQEATEQAKTAGRVELSGEFRSGEGFSYSGLVIEEEEHV